MNHTYRLVWNRSLSMFVAVSECARAMGKSAGGKALSAAALMVAVLASPGAQAQTTTFGYEFGRANSVRLWFGTPVSGAAQEGTINFAGGGVNYTTGFNTPVAVKPVTLVDGVNNFYSDGSALASNGIAANTWQSAAYGYLLPGAYTYNYLPAASPSGAWTPIDNLLASGSINVTADQLERGAGVYIDTYNPFYSASKKQATGTLIFEFGTLKLDTNNATLAQNFTLSGGAGDTIDQSGNSATLTGVIADPAAFNGSINFINSGTGGQVKLTGVNTYTGETNIAAGASLALAGSGSIASSYKLINNGTFDISSASGAASVNQLEGSGAIVLGANTLKSVYGYTTYAGTISGSGGLTRNFNDLTLSGVNTYTGVTQIDSTAGLILSGNGSIANSSNVNVSGVLTFTAANSASLRSLSGTGAINLGANTLTLTEAAGNLAGSIYGTGGVTIAGGTETFSGSNGYSGGTRIDSGARLNLTGFGNLGSSSAAAVNGTLDVSALQYGVTLNKLSGTGNILLGTSYVFIGQSSDTFGGAISGSGNVSLGAGNQTFTGVNTYSGLTYLNPGATLSLSGNGSIANTLMLGGDGTFDIASTASGASIGGLGGTGVVALGSKLLTLTKGGGFAGTMTGSGGLTIASGAHNLLTTQNYTGATNVASGATLNVATATGITSSSGVTANGVLNYYSTGANLRSLGGSGTVYTNGTLALSEAAGNFSGNIGAGGLRIAAGSQALSGVNTYTGVTQIDSGSTLALTGTAAIAGSSGVTSNGLFDISGASAGVSIRALDGSGTVALGANTLKLTQFSSQTFGGVIGGSGGLSVSGGVASLSGVNTYTGVTQVDSNSLLNLAGAGRIANTSNVFLNGGQLSISGANGPVTLNRVSGTGFLNLGANNLTLGSAAGTLSGPIFGSGGLTIAGGTQSFAGAQTYTGATRIDSGARVNFLTGGALSATSGLTLNGTLDASASSASMQFKKLSGNGTLMLGSNTLSITQGGTAFDGTISGTGNLFLTGGTQTLAGVNSYTGFTSIVPTTTLALTGNGSIASSNSVFVSGTLDISGTTNGATVGELNGSGAVVLGAKDLSIKAVNTSFGGSISGTGGLNLLSGNKGLNGALSYTGATRIDTGAMLSVFGAASLSASSAVAVDGTLNLSAGTGTSVLRTLSGSGTVFINSSGMSLSAASGTFSGGINGTGGLTVAGGSETLAGVNSYSGATQIDSGATLTLGGNARLSNSSVVNNGTLVVASTGPASIVSMSGNGAVNLAGQTLVLARASGNYGGVISGNGGLTISSGTQQLSGNNSFTGTVTLQNGATVQAGSSANLGGSANGLSITNGTLAATGSLALNGTTTIGSSALVRADAGATVTLGGAISGSGSLNKTGEGALALGGNNSAYSGKLNISAGTLRLNSANAAGTGAVTLLGGTLQTGANMTLAQAMSLAAGSTVATDAGTSANFAGLTIGAAGTGCVVKAGAGTLNLSGGGSFASGLCVNEGILRLNGSVSASGVTVAAGASLRGAGTLNMPLTVAGILAPGNSPGTLTTSGTVTMLAGSTYQEDINGTGTGSGPGNYSRLIVTGSGQFVAGGATLAPNLVNITGAETYTPYVPQLGDSYRIVSAAGGLVGRFGNIVQPAGLAPQTRLAAFYDTDASHSIDLRVLPTSYQLYLGANGGNRNAQVSGDVLDRLLAASEAGTASAAQQSLATTLASMNGATISGVALGASGEVHAAMAAVAPLTGQTVQAAAARQLALGQSSSALWADLAGKRARWTGDELSSGFRADRGQLTVGADAWRSSAGRAGVGLSHGRASVDAEGGSGKLSENMLFGYGELQAGRVKIDAIAGAGRSSWETERANPLGGSALRSEADGRTAMAGVGVSMPWQIAGIDVAPFARAAWQRVERDGASEGGASAALALDAYSASGVRTTVGVAGNIKGDSLKAAPFTLQYSVAVGRDSGSLAHARVGTTLAGMAAEVVAPNAGRSFVLGSVSGSVMHSASTSSFFGVSTELHGGRTDFSVNGGLRYSF